MSEPTPNTTALPHLASHDAVTQVYDTYRTARMNVKYYGHRLARLQRLGLAVDVMIAVGTSGAVATLALWQSPTGRAVLAALAAAAAVVSVVKPAIGITSRIERLSKLWAEWNIICNGLHRVVLEIGREYDIRPGTESSYREALNRIDQFSGDEDPCPDRRLLVRMQAEVNAEIPPGALWTPAADKAAA